MSSEKEMTVKLKNNKIKGDIEKFIHKKLLYKE